jgi:CubicO group peptidase (beta-lactamase class C family)
MVVSLSKSFTAWGVMNLLDQGKISLDDLVEKYLTRWHFPDSKFHSKDVTVKMLLSHTGGISVGGIQE